MGLDNFAARSPDEELTKEDLKVFEKADIHLRGGILSGPPDSFRGKVYSDMILDITRESLYQEWIPPERVKKMYKGLIKCEPKQVTQGGYDARFINESAIINLRKFQDSCRKKSWT